MRYQSQMNRREFLLNYQLFSAAGDGKLAEVKVLLGRGASPDFVFEDEYCETPLHEAIYHGRLAVASCLIREQKRRDQADADEIGEGSEEGVGILDADSELGTPLHIAVGGGDFRAMRLLLKAGARPDAVGCNGNTPLHLAAQCRNQAMLCELVTRLETIADEGGVIGGEEYDALDLQDPEGNTALHLAAREGHEAIVKLLLSWSADVDARNEESETPLTLALAHGRLAVAKQLLKAGADPNGPRGRSLIGVATEAGDSALVRLLLRHGANVHAECERTTPLRLAIARCNAGIAQLLRDAGADERRRPTRRVRTRELAAGPKKR